MKKLLAIFFLAASLAYSQDSNSVRIAKGIYANASNLVCNGSITLNGASITNWPTGGSGGGTITLNNATGLSWSNVGSTNWTPALNFSLIATQGWVAAQGYVTASITNGLVNTGSLTPYLTITGTNGMFNTFQSAFDLRYYPTGSNPNNYTTLAIAAGMTNNLVPKSSKVILTINGNTGTADFTGGNASLTVGTSLATQADSTISSPAIPSLLVYVGTANWSNKAPGDVSVGTSTYAASAGSANSGWPTTWAIGSITGVGSLTLNYPGGSFSWSPYASNSFTINSDASKVTTGSTYTALSGYPAWITSVAIMTNGVALGNATTINFAAGTGLLRTGGMNGTQADLTNSVDGSVMFTNTIVAYSQLPSKVITNLGVTSPASLLGGGTGSITIDFSSVTAASWGAASLSQLQSATNNVITNFTTTAAATTFTITGISTTAKYWVSISTSNNSGSTSSYYLYPGNNTTNSASVCMYGLWGTPNNNTIVSGLTSGPLLGAVGGGQLFDTDAIISFKVWQGHIVKSFVTRPNSGAYYAGEYESAQTNTTAIAAGAPTSYTIQCDQSNGFGSNTTVRVWRFLSQ